MTDVNEIRNTLERLDALPKDAIQAEPGPNYPEDPQVVQEPTHGGFYFGAGAYARRLLLRKTLDDHVGLVRELIEFARS
jgi:hypothetical protein